MLKKVKSRQLRRKGMDIVVEDREFYHFTLKDGRTAGTKAVSCQEAKDYIEQCLNTEVLKEVV